MKGKKPLKGIVATVITPFDEENRIDYESLEREFEWGVKSGLSGFLVPCGASEIKYLTEEEQVSLFKTAKEICGDKLFLMPNLTGPSDDQVMAQAAKYLDLGADGININTHWSPRKSDPECFVNLVKRIDRELHPDFMCLQDDDQQFAPGIPVSLIAYLFREVESLRAIKCEIGRTTVKTTAIKKATNGEMLVYGADYSHHSLEGYDRGMDGLMPSGMFEIFVNIYRLYHEKSREKAAELFFDSLPCVLFTRQSGAINREYHKEYMKRIGVFRTTGSREPTFDDDDYTIAYRHQMIEKALRIVDCMDKYWR